jgi:hypothetical protein
MRNEFHILAIELEGKSIFTRRSRRWVDSVVECQPNSEYFNHQRWLVCGRSVGMFRLPTKGTEFVFDGPCEAMSL